MDEESSTGSIERALSSIPLAQYHFWGLWYCRGMARPSSSCVSETLLNYELEGDVVTEIRLRRDL